MENVKTMSMVEVLESALNVGFVKFTYTKVDGTKRIAVGTRNHNLITNLFKFESNGNGKNRIPKDYLLSYFDVAKMSFRSFYKENLVSIEYSDLSTETAIAYALETEFKETQTINDNLQCFAIDVLGGDMFNGLMVSMVHNVDIDVVDTMSNLSKHIDTKPIVEQPKYVGSVGVAVKTETKAKAEKTEKEFLLADLVSVRTKIAELQKRETEILVQLFVFA